MTQTHDAKRVAAAMERHAPERRLLPRAIADVEVLADEVTRLRAWVSDCQSGMYISCVYCGHRYGPREDTPVAMADVLKEHIEQCPEHPLSHAKAEHATLREAYGQQQTTITELRATVEAVDRRHREVRDAIAEERNQLRKIIKKLPAWADRCIDIANQLHGISHTRPAKREVDALEHRLREAAAKVFTDPGGES